MYCTLWAACSRAKTFPMFLSGKTQQNRLCKHRECHGKPWLERFCASCEADFFRKPFMPAWTQVVEQRKEQLPRRKLYVGRILKNFFEHMIFQLNIRLRGRLHAICGLAAQNRSRSKLVNYTQCNLNANLYSLPGHPVRIEKTPYIKAGEKLP